MMRITFLSSFLFVLLCSCSSSYTDLTWSSEQKSAEKLSKVLIVVPEAKDQTNRQLLEKELSLQLSEKGYQADPSSRFFEQMTRESVIEFLETNGYDGALVIRLKEITHESRFEPSRHTSSNPNVDENVFGRSFDERGYNFNTVDRVIVLESKLFATKETQLLTVIESKTFSLYDIDALVADYSKAVTNYLNRSKLLMKSTQ